MTNYGASDLQTSRKYSTETGPSQCEWPKAGGFKVEWAQESLGLLA